MAYLLRLVAFFLLLSTVLPSLANTVNVYVPRQDPSIQGSSYSDACALWAQSRGGVVVSEFQSPYGYYSCSISINGAPSISSVIDEVIGCEDGSQPVNGECPVNPCEDLQGTKITGSYTYTNNPQQLTCAGGCEFSDSSTVTVCLNSGDCHTDSFTATGNQCSPNDEEATDSVCPEGQSPYSINGVESCIDHLDNPDATAQETDTTTVTDQTNNTETTTQTTTECNGGTCITTNTTTTTDNNTGQSTQQTETTEQPQNSFCKQNPEAAICKEKKSSFGGDCNSAFSCEGDAVQCAIAREQHSRNCALFETTTALSDLGNDIANGNDPLTTPSPDNPETIAFNPQIDSSNPYSDTGLTDMSVDFKGQVLTIPFSNLNDSLNILGKILLASSWLFALVTLKGAVVD